MRVDYHHGLLHYMQLIIYIIKMELSLTKSNIIIDINFTFVASYTGYLWEKRFIQFYCFCCIWGYFQKLQSKKHIQTDIWI